MRRRQMLFLGQNHMATYDPPEKNQDQVHTSNPDKAPTTRGRLFYIDNIRSLIIILVVIHHLAIIYGGLGSDSVSGIQADFITTFLLAWFAFVNQAFFMGLLFFISGYLTPRSFTKNGARQFILKRLLRLGIPLLIYDFLVNPPIVYWQVMNTQSGTRSLGEFFANYFDFFTGIGTGPMWFVENLLLFNLAYAALHLLQPANRADSAPTGRAPGMRGLIGYAIFLTALTFFVRLRFPIGWESFFNLRLQYYPQYVTLFFLGSMTYNQQWLAAWPSRLGKIWLRMGVFFSLLFPGMIMLVSADNLRGGLHVGALLFAGWETLILLGLGFGLLLLFRERYNQTGSLQQFLSINSYTVYIIHVLVIFVLGLALKNIQLYPLAKFGLVTLIAVPLCFILSHWIVRKLPFADRIL
jgi:glucans biosynthesis protein C